MLGMEIELAGSGPRGYPPLVGQGRGEILRSGSDSGISFHIRIRFGAG